MTTNKFLRYSIIGLILLVPLVAMIVTSSLFFPYITGKNLAFRLIVEIAAVLYVWLALLAPEYRPRLTPVLISFLSFISVLFVADIFSEHVPKAFFSNFERMEGFVTTAHLFVYFLITGAMFASEKVWKIFLQVSLGVSVILGFIGINQLTDGIIRIDSRLGNPTYLGGYMLFNVFIAAFLFISFLKSFSVPRKNKWSSMALVIYPLIALLDLYIMYKSGTRGALIGFAGGTFLIALLFAIKEKNKILKYGGIAFIVLSLATAGALSYFKDSTFVDNNKTLNRYAEIVSFSPEALQKYAEEEGRSRFVIWSMSLEGFKERPILGWGQDNFNYVFNKYYDPKIYDAEQWFDRAHNVFFDWLIAGGILGLLSYLALFILGVVSVWRSNFLFAEKAVLSGVLAAYFIHNLFVFDHIVSYIIFFSILAIIYSKEKEVISIPVMKKKIAKDSYIYAGGCLAIVLGIICIYKFTSVPYLQAKTLIKAISYQSYGLQKNSDPAFKVALDSYQKALSYGGPGAYEVREQLFQGSASLIYYPKASDQVRSAFLNLTDTEFKKQLAETPNDARYFYFYAIFLSNASQITDIITIDDAEVFFNKASDLSPRKQGILIQATSAYLNAEKYDKAVDASKKAFELYKENPDAASMYVTALIYSDNQKEAEAVRSTLEGTKAAVHKNIIKAYYDKKRPDKIQEILDQKIELAKNFSANGRLEEALIQIQEVIEIDPSFKEEGQQLIKEFYE